MTQSHNDMATAAPALSRERRRRRRYDDTRARILAAAADLFARHGIANTRVESITETADVAKGTFFNYFPTKEAAALELAKRLITDLWLVAQRARHADSVRPVLEAVPGVFLEAFGGHPLLFRSVLGVAMLHDQQHREFAEIEEATRAHLAQILQRGQELGEIRSDRAAGELAVTLHDALWGALASWRDDVDIARRMALMLEIFWTAAASPKSAEESWAV